MKAKRVIQVVGCHAGGEVGNVIVGGVLPPAGKSMFEKMQTMQREHDDIRKMLMLEPRGSVAQHYNLLVPPTRSDCDAGVIIMEPTEYVPMSGSNTICAVTVLLETGILPMQEPQTRLKLDMPGGVVEVLAQCKDGKVESVEFQNVPSFVLKLDAPLELPGRAPIYIDIAYGGMIYAIADAKALGFELVPSEARELSRLGEQIRKAAREQHPVVHPENPEIAGVSIVQFANPFEGVGQVTRNAVVVAPGRLDRSATGTGLSARMAVLHARGELQVGQSMFHASVIGSQFRGEIAGTAQLGNTLAILPRIRGSAYITGFYSVMADPTDPFPEGYVLSDTWGVSGTTEQ